MSEPDEPTQNDNAAEPVLFGARNAQMEQRNWTPLIVGFGLMLVVVALVAMLGRGKKEVVKTADAYAPNLVVEQARLSQADNFVGATVTYIDLTVKNNGTRTVVGGAVGQSSAIPWGRWCRPKPYRCGRWFRTRWAVRTRRAIWRRRRSGRDRRASCG